MKGIIFDFNGTLFFDSHLHYDAWRIYSKKLRVYEFTDDEMREKMFGRTNADIIEYAIGRKPETELVEKLAKEKEALYRNECLKNKENMVLSAGAEKFLDFLKENNIPRTIATMSEWDNVEFYIKECDVDRPYKIYWKVRNVGKKARERNDIRGNIVQGESTHKEKSVFHGPHYVECYVIKNGICVARDRIDVPIE